MSRKLLAAMALALLVLWPVSAHSSEPLPPAASWVPQDAIAAVELSDPKAVLDLVLDPKLVEAVTALPAYEGIAAQPGFQQFQQVVKFLEVSLDTDHETGLRKLVGVLSIGDLIRSVIAEQQSTINDLAKYISG